MKSFKSYIKEASGFPTSPPAEVPNNLGEAANLFKKSQSAKNLFGEDFVNHFANTRIWEYKEFQKNRSFLESDAISPWELKRYFQYQAPKIYSLLPIEIHIQNQILL